MCCLQQLGWVEVRDREGGLVRFPSFAQALVLSVAALPLVSCGGDEGEEVIPEDAEAAGIYFGTVNLNGISRSFQVVVAADGVFTGTIGSISVTSGDPRLLIGRGLSDGNGFSATGTVFAASAGAFLPGAASTVNVTNGVIVEHQQMTGTYAAVTEAGAFTLNYLTELTNRGAMLSLLAGTYNLPLPAPNGATATLTIDSAGAVTYQTSTGCSGSGNISIQDPSINVYDFSISVGGCVAYSGIAFAGLMVLQDASAGARNNLLVMFGADQSRSRFFAFTGVK